METVGKRLKKQRELRNIALAVAAKVTKIRPERLAEMEEDNFSKITGLSYQREFLRTYAKYLKIDAHDLINQFNEQFGYEDEDYGAIRHNAPVRPLISKTREVKLRPAAIVTILIALFILLVLLPIFVNLWRVGVIRMPERQASAVQTQEIKVPIEPSTNQNPLVTDQNVSQEGIDQPVAPVKETPVTLNKLAIRAVDDCWIRVTLDGQVDENDPGIQMQGATVQEWEGTKFKIEVFNPSLVLILFNGQEVAGFSESTEPKTIVLP